MAAPIAGSDCCHVTQCCDEFARVAMAVPTATLNSEVLMPGVTVTELAAGFAGQTLDVPRQEHAEEEGDHVADPM